MREIKIYIYAMLSIALLSSCTDWLSIKPQTQTVLEDYWTSEADVEAVLATCYRAMQDDAFMKRLMVWGELRSEDFASGNSSIPDEDAQMMLENIQTTNSNASWSSFYAVINYCNTILYYAPLAAERDANFTQSALKAKQAEALTLRALCYFYLVRTFKDVPFVTTPSNDDTRNYQVAKSTDLVILDSIAKDLEVAQVNAVSGFAGSSNSYNYNKGRITKSAVRALLADIYLWMASTKELTDSCGACRTTYLEKAVSYCDAVLTDKYGDAQRYELEKKTSISEPYNQIFGQGNSSESIFELQFKSTIKENSNIFSLYGSMDTPRGYYVANSLLNSDTNIYPSTGTDSRRFDSFTDVVNNGTYNIFKYTGLSRYVTTDANNKSINVYYYRTSSPNWIFYRLPEVMLIKAEALAMLARSTDDLNQALSLVNTIYLRSNTSLLTAPFTIDTYSTSDKILELIILERHREFVFEGKRWFDLVRYSRRLGDATYLATKVARKQTTSQSTVKNKFKDLNSLYMPIYQSELKTNSKLVQNPFYATISSN